MKRLNKPSRTQTGKQGLLSGFVFWLCLPIVAQAGPSVIIYEGDLIPGNYDAVIPIKLEVTEENGLFSGTGQALMPGMTQVHVSSGKRTGLECDLTLQFSNQDKANLEGKCDQDRFEGKYRLWDTKGRKKKGMVRLIGSKPKKKKDEEKENLQEKQSETVAPMAHSATYCLKKKVACLQACPRGDYNTEFLCVNACRHKKSLCLGKRGFGSPVPPTVLSPLPQEALPKPEAKN